MVREGDVAPTFTLPKAGGRSYDDVEPFSLSDALGDGPIVLAFYPAAFTGGCTEEMCAFRDGMDGFEALDAAVYGISVDLPFAQNVWIDRHGLGIEMLSDWNHEVIADYDVVYEMAGGIEVAQRAVFVVDASGIVTYRWVRTDGNPEFEPFVEEVREAVAAARDGSSADDL